MVNEGFGYKYRVGRFGKFCFNLIFYGCTGSSLLCVGFLQLW